MLYNHPTKSLLGYVLRFLRIFNIDSTKRDTSATKSQNSYYLSNMRFRKEKLNRKAKFSSFALKLILNELLYVSFKDV